MTSSSRWGSRTCRRGRDADRGGVEGVSTCVWVACRYITAHRRPAPVASTSSTRCSMVLRWASSHSRCSVCSPSLGSVSGRGPIRRRPGRVGERRSGDGVRGIVSHGAVPPGAVYAGRMDVRSIEDVAPVVEHTGPYPSGGSCRLGDEGDHRRRSPRAGERVRGRRRRLRRPPLAPDPRVLLRHRRSWSHDHRRRDP